MITVPANITACSQKVVQRAMQNICIKLFTYRRQRRQKKKLTFHFQTTAGEFSNIGTFHFRNFVILFIGQMDCAYSALQVKKGRGVEFKEFFDSMVEETNFLRDKVYKELAG